MSKHSQLNGEPSVTSPQASEAGETVQLGGMLRDYVSLLKPRVISLVVFTAISGVIVAPGEIHPVLAACAILSVALAAGGAASINMWYDHDIDLVMSRTRQRAIPSGRLPRGEALTFGVCLILPAVMMMWMAAGVLAASLLAFSSIFYAVIYTMWLKRTTPQNIVIGGAAGAFPPMIGYVAVTGEIDLLAMTMFVIIFLWTPPHFWALSLYRREDYNAAELPMLPVTHGEAVTKWQMLIYSIGLAIIAVVPAVLLSSAIYGVGSAVLGLIFILAALQTFREDGKATDYKAARRMFRYSIIYLFAIFSLLIISGIMRY